MARSAVDEAMKNILLPQIEKEKLVEQLQTKVRDLERFIEFIQTNKEAKDLDLPQLPNDSANRGIISRGISAIIKIGSILPYVFLRNFGCQKDKIASKYPENTESVQDNSNVISSPPGSTKEIIKPAEIQDLIHTVNLVKLAYQRHNLARKRQHKKENEEMVTMERLVSVVRRQLSMSIAQILTDKFKLNTSVISSAVSAVTYPVSGCFRTGNASNNEEEAAWQIMLRFYELRGGAILKEAPKSALRHAFGMNDPLLGKNDNERTLLRTIHQVSESHLKYKAIAASMFRAIICYGLNNRCLTAWLHCVVTELKSEYYDGAFLRVNGADQFLAALLPLEKLCGGFDLPANLAIKNLDEMKDAF